MALGITDGASLMRASFEVVRRHRSLLWFPVVSTACLVLTAGFWIFEGAWLYSVRGPALLFVGLALFGLYSLTFIGIFFGVALAGATGEAIEGGEPTFADGVAIAWSRLNGIAVWACYSIVVSLLLQLVESFKGFRLLGKTAEVAWSFATIFVVPLIAFEGVAPRDARRRSFRLAKDNWRAESGGLAALRIALIVPGVLFYLDGKLLFGGHVHSLAGKALLGAVLLCGIGLTVAASVVRQVFAVRLYRLASVGASELAS